MNAADIMLPYTIVEFIGTDKRYCDIIATMWLNDEEDQCQWPPVSNTKAGKLAMKLANPDVSWKIHSVRVLGKAGS